MALVQIPSVTITHLSGFGTLYKQVAGLHRASPSTTLDKLFVLLYHIVLKKSIVFRRTACYFFIYF